MFAQSPVTPVQGSEGGALSAIDCWAGAQGGIALYDIETPKYLNFMIYFVGSHSRIKRLKMPVMEAENRQ